MVLNGTTNDVEMANIVLAYRDMVVNTVKLHPDRLVELGSVVPEADLHSIIRHTLTRVISTESSTYCRVAKSTELLLMNQTRLDEFLEANPQYREANMESWEGWNGWLRDIFSGRTA